MEIFINFGVVTFIMGTAMYAFTGDPIHNGHIDLIDRIAKIYDKVIVGFGVNPGKNPLFSLDERKAMAQKSLSKYDNVEIVSFPGLLIDYAYEHNVDVIIKGVRNSTDFDYENLLHLANESQNLGVDTHVLFSTPKLAHVSSSMVKGVVKEHGLIHEYVPIHVKQAVEERILEQYVIGITGEIGSGKSYVGKQFEELGKKYGVPVHNIELDYIGHDILGKLTLPKYVEIRNQIVKEFGQNLKQEDGFINRKELGNIVFNDADKLDRLNEIMVQPLSVRLKRELYGKKGLILINAALIAESDMSYLCNNNTVLIKVDKDTQKTRLKPRNLTSEQLKRRLNSQFDYGHKLTKLYVQIQEDNHGNIWTLNNSIGQDDIESVFNQVIKYFKLNTK